MVVRRTSAATRPQVLKEVFGIVSGDGAEGLVAEGHLVDCLESAHPLQHVTVVLERCLAAGLGVPLEELLTEGLQGQDVAFRRSRRSRPAILARDERSGANLRLDAAGLGFRVGLAEQPAADLTIEREPEQSRGDPQSRRGLSAYCRNRVTIAGEAAPLTKTAGSVRPSTDATMIVIHGAGSGTAYSTRALSSHST